MNLHSSVKAVLVSALLAAAAFAADPKDDHKFVEEAAGGGLAEVRLGQLAVDRSSDSSVKEFAQQMVTDHSKANDELKSLVAGRDVKIPAELPKDQQKKWDDLNKLSLEKFDKAYVDAMVDDHKTDVKLFEKEAKSGDDATVKAFAGRTLPTLKHHLEMALSLQKNLKNKKSASNY
jgi:putative membrane protein